MIHTKEKKIEGKNQKWGKENKIVIKATNCEVSVGAKYVVIIFRKCISFLFKKTFLHNYFL